MSKNAKKEAKKSMERENSFYQMARELCTVEEMEKKLGINKYEILLKLREEGIATREQVEKLINTTNLSNQEIAEQTRGSTQVIERIRDEMAQKKKILDSIPPMKKKRITQLLGMGEEYSIQYVATVTKTPETIIALVAEELKKNREATSLEKKKQVNFKIEMLQFRSHINQLKVPTETDKDVIPYHIEKILAEYEMFLTETDYAFIAYAYMKIGDYLNAIQFGEKYLNLQEPSISGVTKKIDEVLENAKKQQRVKEKQVPSVPSNDEGR